MRLINADELHTRFKEISFGDLTGDELAMVMKFYDMINNTPTIDAEPVRHGQWIEDGPGWICSYCGTEFKDEIEFVKLDYDYYMPHYCPHCGAKMDLED